MSSMRLCLLPALLQSAQCLVGLRITTAERQQPPLQLRMMLGAPVTAAAATAWSHASLLADVSTELYPESFPLGADPTLKDVAQAR